MSEGGESPKGWKAFLPDWARKRENVRLKNVTLGDLQDAHDKRGVSTETTAFVDGKTTTTIIKVAVKGDGPLVPPS